jgi:cyclophilin family peptidyl-prolyl cis-trans isomerase
MATAKRERQKAARRHKLQAAQRAAKRRRTIQRTVIVVAVAAVIILSAAYFFGSSSSSKSTAPLSTTTTLASTGTTVPASATGGITQAQANAIAVRAGCPASTSTRVNTLHWSSPPPMTINTSKTYDAHVVTTAGTFVIRLDAATAPITVNNFVFLARHHFYNCVIFHRVIPGFVVQGGDPTGTGTGGPGYTIADEYPKAGHPTYPLYSVAMANTGAPHTGGSQFFIVTGAQGEALPPQYSLFGQVVRGQHVVQIINDAGSASGVPPTVTHRMLSVTITES